MNKFADLTSAEFAKYMGFKKHTPSVRDTSKFLARTERTPITAGARKDWREAGVVNAVKDQGQCVSTRLIPLAAAPRRSERPKAHLLFSGIVLGVLRRGRV